MPPPIKNISLEELPARVQIAADGKWRKTVDGRRIDLVRDCELLGLVQYKTEILHPERRESPIQCYEVQRLFRKCQDKKGEFMVETTAWEGTMPGRGSDAATARDKAKSESAHNEQTSKNPQSCRIM